MLPKKVQHYQIIRNRDKDRLIVYYHPLRSCASSNKQLLWRESNSVFDSIKGRQIFFCVSNTKSTHFLAFGWLFQVFYRERFIQIFEIFQHFLHFFHVNHEEVMNINRTNTAFKVFLHYLQYALEVLRVLR